ncbi:MAG: DUF4301 family protein [Alistipes shahii]
MPSSATELNYGRKPMGLVTFHAYPEGARQGRRGAPGRRGGLRRGRRRSVRIHFTVSPEHVAGFKELLAAKVPLYEKRFGVRYEISFSCANTSTDTLAVNPDNTPFRQDDGTLHVPSGGPRGADREPERDRRRPDLHQRSIDNVTTDARRGDTVRYKKVLAGVPARPPGRAFEVPQGPRSGAAAELEPIAEFIGEAALA